MTRLQAKLSVELFDAPDTMLRLEDGATLWRGLALPTAGELLDEIARVARGAPFRHLLTPGGQRMSVAMSNCGTLGWVSDRRGYRYEPLDPGTGRPWPRMPSSFLRLAAAAAKATGFASFAPDACLLNRYEAGARMSLHQDRDEADLRQPIVSVSLGLPAVFLWGGATRRERPRRLSLRHGDVVVWGGPARLRFHGVAPLAAGEHPLSGDVRYNLTFRKAG